jgi:ATP-dependent Clp protease protease subunit
LLKKQEQIAEYFMPETTDALKARAADGTSLSKAFEHANQNEWTLANIRGQHDRVIVLNGELTREKADAICMQMLSLAAAKPGQDILFYINSPGGSVTAGMAIYDTMKRINCDVRTIGSGQCASMGSFLLAAGTKGKRTIMPNAQIMMHQPSAGTQGKITDMETDLEEFRRIKARMTDLYAHFLDISREDCVKLMERDNYVNAVAAMELGHVDQIVVKTPGPNQVISEDDQKLFRLEKDIQQRELAARPDLLEIIARRKAGLPKQAPVPANDSGPIGPMPAPRLAS